jgi:hypothetical protein
VKPPSTLTLRALNRATLARQILLARERVPVLRAVERLVGLQAQLARPPFVGLWSRVEGFRREALARLLERRAAVRAPFFRHTIHLVSAGDFVSFRTTVQAALDRPARSILRGVRADVAEIVAEARAFFLEEPRTFEALRTHLAARFPGDDPRQLAFAVRTWLPLVQVPSGGPWSFPGAAAFAVAEAWLEEPLARASAPEALVLRYLAAFGPATAADAQAWSGVPDLRTAVAALRPRLRALRDEDGRELLDLPRAPRPDEDVPAPVRFLPEYDNLLLGHADRRRVVSDAHRARLTTTNLVVPGTLLVDGFVAGTWKASRRKAVSRVEVTPFGRLSHGERAAVFEEGEGLARFLEPEAAKVEVAMAG